MKLGLIASKNHSILRRITLKTKFLILLATVAILVLVTIALPLSFNVVEKPLDFCTAPYDWGACQDWAYKGLRLTWGAEKYQNSLAVLNLEDRHMIWNGTAYDRRVSKTYMLQSSLLGDTPIGNCGGWVGVCYKYSEHTDTFTP